MTTEEKRDQVRPSRSARSRVVEHPAHYAGDGIIECMDAMRSMMSGPIDLSPIAAHWWAEAFKYIWRWRHKGGVQDLRKCKQCIDYLIREVGDGDGR